MARREKAETFSRYDTADYLKSDEDIVAHLEAAMEEGGDDPAFIAVALGNIARAHWMVQAARGTGLTREGRRYHRHVMDSLMREASGPDRRGLSVNEALRIATQIAAPLVASRSLRNQPVKAMSLRPICICISQRPECLFSIPRTASRATQITFQKS